MFDVDALLCSLFVKHVLGLTFCSSVRYFSNHQSIWTDSCYFA